MTRIAKEDDAMTATENARGVQEVLEAIDRLLDAMEHFDAPITRELLRTSMMALVHECGLAEGPPAAPH